MAGRYDDLETSNVAGRSPSRVAAHSHEDENRLCCLEASSLDALRPTEFTAFTEFQSRKLRPGETVHMYLHQLTQLLDASMSGLDEDSKKKILFQQFLSGVPD